MNARALKSGTILNGKYMIESVIGEGGFGITYRATDLTLEETVAIKEYFPSAFATRDTTSGQSDEITIFSGDAAISFDKGVRKFEEEAARLAGFRKEPGIVGVLSFFYENNTGYMVMEYIDGVTLKDYLAGKGGKLSQDETLRIISPIIRALTGVHKAGIVHRDISPDNIMITGSGDAKLIDFGAARYVGTTDEKSLTVVLKEGYAPPEQYHTDGKQGPWTDIYAVCATIYKMISGNTPVGASERLIGNDRLISLAKIADVDKYFSSVIEKGMSLDKDKRYPSAEKLLAALEGKDKGRRYRKYFIIGGGIASVIILVGVILTVIKLVGLKANNNAVAHINKKTNTENGETTGDNIIDIGITGDNAGVEIEYTEEDLRKRIEEKSGLIVAAESFLDFDTDAQDEMFALVQSKEGDHKEIWYADGGKAKWLIDLESKSYEADQKGRISILEFDDNRLWSLSFDVNDKTESFIFGAENNKAFFVYQGTDVFEVNNDGKLTAQKLEYEWNPDTYESIAYYAEPVEVLYNDKTIYDEEITIRLINSENGSNIYAGIDEGDHLGNYEGEQYYYAFPEEWDESEILSDEELYDQCVKYFCSKFQIIGDVSYPSEIVFDDYDSDGNNEAFVYLSAYEGMDAQGEGLYYVDGKNIISIDEAESVGQLFYDLSPLIFGKEKICYASLSGFSSSYGYFFKISDNAIKCTSIPSYTFDIETEDVLCCREYIYNYDESIGVYKTFNADGDDCSYFYDKTKIWYLDNKFVECASIKITEDEFISFNDGKEILSSYKDYLRTYFDGLRKQNEYWNEYYSMYDENDLQIESILMCSDDHIYINCIPFKNVEIYDWNEGLGNYEFIITPFYIKFKYDQDGSLVFEEVNAGYRDTRCTSFLPYYPDIEEIKFTSGNDISDNSDQNVINEFDNNEGVSDDDLCQRASDYYYDQYGVRPPYIDLEPYDGDIVAIHLYERVEDGEYSHTATWDWYYVNRVTGETTNILGESFNIFMD